MYWAIQLKINLSSHRSLLIISNVRLFQHHASAHRWKMIVYIISDKGILGEDKVIGHLFFLFNCEDL